MFCSRWGADGAVIAIAMIVMIIVNMTIFAMVAPVTYPAVMNMIAMTIVITIDIPCQLRKTRVTQKSIDLKSLSFFQFMKSLISYGEQ